MILLVVGSSLKKERTVQSVDITTTQGNQIIYAGHAPLIGILKPNSVVTYTLGDMLSESFTVKGGTVEVSRNSVTIILDE